MTKSTEHPWSLKVPPEIFDDLTRREFLIGAGLIVLAPGCGSGDEGANGGETSNETRVVKDASGDEVEVPAEARRIVALGEVELDSLLALGIEPAATIQGRGQDGPPNYLADEAEEIPLVGVLTQPNVEAIAELEPDLILASFAFGPPFADEQVIGNLKEITPATLVSSAAEETWQDSLRRIANAVNRSEAGEEAISDYEQSVEEARAELGERVGDTLSIVRWQADGPVYMFADNVSSLVVEDLGFERPEAQNEPGLGHSDPLSLEQLDLIDGDWLFVGTLGGGEDEEALEEIREDRLWQQVEAVRSDHVVSVDGSLWTSVVGPLGARRIVADVLEGIVGS
ncbi:MAG: ABC transporter substrate-binding protein [Rubrobacteraceae bacterium]